MADTKLTNLPAATSLDNSDSLYVVQSGVSKKISATALFATHVADHDAHGALEDADIPASIARDSEVTAAINAHLAVTTSVHGIADTSQIGLKNASNTWTATQVYSYGALASGQARTIYEFKPLSGSATDPSNFLVMNTQEFDIGSPYCSSMYFGFNIGGGGTRVMVGHPAIGFVTEGNWFQDGVQYAEAHCFYVSKANVQYRPFSITVNADTDNIAFAHYADSVGFSGKLGYSVFALTLGADAAHSNINISAPVHMTQSFQFDAGGSFNCAVNNVLFFNQLNAAGNAYIPIAFVDSSNIIELGPSGAVAVYLNIPLRIAGYLQHEGLRAGFYNTPPIVQQVLDTGAGKTVDNVITFLQTIGLCKQA